MNGCPVRDIPQKHRANNNSDQCLVVVRAKNQSDVAEIIRTSVPFLRKYCLIQVMDGRRLLTYQETAYHPTEDEVGVIFYSPDGFTQENVGFDRNWYRLDTGECVLKN